MRKNSKQQVYACSKKEKIIWTVQGILLITLLAYFFYRSLLAIPLLTPLLFIFLKEKRKDYMKKKQKETGVQFKDAILAAAGSLRAGYAVENAFRQAYNDMVALHGRNSIICKELYQILTGIDNNMTLEKQLKEFGIRSKVEDVEEFADVFAAAKRSGGNVAEIIEKSAAVIAEKVEVEKEIQVLISARQMEQRVMNVVPFCIIFYISATSKGFFDVLYHNAVGVLIMTICLLIYMAAILLSRKIVAIEV